MADEQRAAAAAPTSAVVVELKDSVKVVTTTVTAAAGTLDHLSQSVDRAVAQATQAAIIIYKPFLVILTGLSFGLGSLWYNFATATANDLYPSSSLASVTAYWIYALVFFLITYVPMYIVYRIRNARTVKSGLELTKLDTMKSGASMKDIGQAQIGDQLVALETGVVNKTIDVFLDNLSYIAMNAFSTAVQNSSPFPSTSGWSFLIFAIFAVVSFVVIYLEMQAIERIKETNKVEAKTLDKLCSLTIGNLAPLEALMFGAALQLLLTENSGSLQNSGIVIAWIYFAIASLLCFGAYYYQAKRLRLEKKASKPRREATVNVTVEELDELEKDILWRFMHLKSMQSMFTLAETFITQGLLYLSAVTFHYAVITSIAFGIYHTTDTSTLSSTAFFIYAACITPVVLVVSHVMDTTLHSLSTKQLDENLVILLNDTIEMAGNGFGFVVGKAWATALKLQFQSSSNSLVQNFLCAFIATVLFILLNYWIMRYYPHKGRALLRKLQLPDAEEKPLIELAVSDSTAQGTTVREDKPLVVLALTSDSTAQD